MAFTKITHAGIGSTGTVLLENLEVTGVGTFGGSVSVGGTLTYEDVTNIDSVGIITARAGVLVGSGITLSKDGDVFFTGIATGNGSGLTALNASNISSGTVPTARLGSGTASSSTFLRGDSTFQTVSTDLVDDTSPQLGGNLDVNTKNIVFGDSSGASDDRLTFGAGADLSIYHDGNNNYIDGNSAAEDHLYIRANVGSDHSSNIHIQAKSGEESIVCRDDEQVELYYDGNQKFKTISTGVLITGSDDGDGGAKGDFKFFQTDGTLKIMFDASTSQFEFLDNSTASFGSDDDLKIFHDGSTNRINASNGNLTIQAVTQHDIALTHAGENMLVAKADGAVELYHDGNRQVFTIDGGMNWQDNKKAEFGNSGDLKIYHDGSTSIISSPSHAIAHYSNTRHHFLNYDGSANVAVLSPQGQCDFYNNGTLKLEVEGNGIQVHNGGLDLNRQAQPYSAAIYFAGFGDTNHMLWHDYYDNPNGTRSSASGFDGVKWNVYAGLRLYTGNEAETVAQFNGNGACELWYDNVKQINTHPNGIFTRGIYPMADNSFDIGSSSQRFKRVYATNGSIQTSDRNQKNTIIESDLGLDFVNKLKPVSYKWNEDDGKTHYGLIVQDVEETLIDIGKTVSDFGAVLKENDSPMGLGYSELISPLIKAVQELTAKNDALEARIKTLEG